MTKMSEVDHGVGYGGGDADHNDGCGGIEFHEARGCQAAVRKSCSKGANMLGVLTDRSELLSVHMLSADCSAAVPRNRSRHASCVQLSVGHD